MMTHKDLKVWQKSMVLVKDIYQMTISFPQQEMFGIVSQMRRAAVSIPSNIAEGYGRASDRELAHFLQIALGSASELDTQVILSRDLGFCTEETYKCLSENIIEIIKMLSSLAAKCRLTINTRE